MKLTILAARTHAAAKRVAKATEKLAQGRLDERLAINLQGAYNRDPDIYLLNLLEATADILEVLAEPEPEVEPEPKPAKQPVRAPKKALGA